MVSGPRRNGKKVADEFRQTGPESSTNEPDGEAFHTGKPNRAHIEAGKEVRFRRERKTFPGPD